MTDEEIKIYKMLHVAVNEFLKFSRKQAGDSLRDDFRQAIRQAQYIVMSLSVHRDMASRWDVALKEKLHDPFPAV